VPETAERDVYLVLDDFGRIGRSWREMDEERTGRETVITDLMDGQCSDPVRIVASTPHKVGRATSPRTWPTRSVDAAQPTGSMPRLFWNPSSTAIAAADQRNCRYRCHSACNIDPRSRGIGV
jgi:hypothetical protein